MKIAIKTTKIYEKNISKLLTGQRRYEMENQIAIDPLNWPVIRETGGVRKARFSRDSIGKRGGGRVCYLYLTVYETIYFLLAYAKNEKDDLSEQDKKKIRKVVKQILETIGDE
ncbi:MAG: hypothetical protein ACD_50C00077G0003 [uncultured bacterium]|jgi:hypothetical protein|nr:MAG: hypothetical protein ACD_50C00077G0003 [uncultured bacterium]